MLALGGYAVLRPRLASLGASQSEVERAYPGDDLIATPSLTSTRAVTIHAPVETVWTWIAQMGRGGSGYYGLDQLSNHGQPSVAYVRNDLDAPQVGAAMDGGFKLLAVEPERLLLYGGFDVPTPLGYPIERTTLMMLEPLEGGKTRLVVRTRGYSGGPLAQLGNAINEISELADGLAQLNNIRQRAEIMNNLHAKLA